MGEACFYHPDRQCLVSCVCVCDWCGVLCCMSRWMIGLLIFPLAEHKSLFYPPSLNLSRVKCLCSQLVTAVCVYMRGCVSVCGARARAHACTCVCVFCAFCLCSAEFAVNLQRKTGNGRNCHRSHYRHQSWGVCLDMTQSHRDWAAHTWRCRNKQERVKKS